MKLRLMSTVLVATTFVACATTTPKNSTPVTVSETAKVTTTAPSSTVQSEPIISEPVQSKPIQLPTKVAKNMQSVALSTTPEGASCTIKAGDELLGTVLTPGNVVIKRMNWKFGADVVCSKEGFVTTNGRLANNPAENQIGGNIGAIFTAVKMLEGSLAAWDDSVHLSLKPAYFTSTSQRDSYLDAQTALLNSKFTTASSKYLTCKRKKCTRKMAELQTAYDADLGKLKADVAAIPLK